MDCAPCQQPMQRRAGDALSAATDCHHGDGAAQHRDTSVALAQRSTKPSGCADDGWLRCCLLLQGWRADEPAASSCGLRKNASGANKLEHDECSGYYVSETICAVYLWRCR